MEKCSSQAINFDGKVYKWSLIRWKKCDITDIIRLKKCKILNRQLNSGKASFGIGDDSNFFSM